MTIESIIEKLSTIAQQPGYLELWLEKHGYVDYKARAESIRDIVQTSMTPLAELTVFCPAMVLWLEEA